MSPSKKELEKGEAVEDLHDGNQEVDPIKQAADEFKAKEEAEKQAKKENVNMVHTKEKASGDEKMPEEPAVKNEKEELTSDEEQKMEHALKAEEEIKALDKMTSQEQKIIANRLQKQLNFNRNHPHGVTLLARDNENNRRLFPDGPFGTIDVAESECQDNKCPPYSKPMDFEGKNAKETPIHILIAAFRDKLCSRTLHYAFSQAENPSRLFIRVIDQTQPGSDLEDDTGCWELYCERYNTNCREYKSQVRIIKIDSAQSLGPTYARSKLSAMVHWDYINRDNAEEIDLQVVNEQDFCMQIDSHMNFSKSFDTRLIEMHHRTKNDYAVLSTYVTDIEANDKDERTVPNLCMVTFTGSIRNWGTKECKYLIRPKLTNAMWGAGLSFHRCHGELTVPVDPYLDNVFDGEEGSRGIRFFTHGYDVYTPDIVLVTHDYKTHQGNPVVHTWGRGANRHQDENEDGMKLGEGKWKWSEEIEKSRSALKVFGTDRVNMLLGIGSHHNSTKLERKELDLIRNSRFGLGTKRTMEQVREFTGINLLERKMESNKCGNNYWVPYEESRNYGIQEVLARGNVGKVRALVKPKEIEQAKLVKVPKLEEKRQPDLLENELQDADVELKRAKKKSAKKSKNIAVGSMKLPKLEEKRQPDPLENELQDADVELNKAAKKKSAKKSKKNAVGRMKLRDPLVDTGRKKIRGGLGDDASPDQYNRIDRAKQLIGNARPQIRHAAEVLKAKEEAILAGVAQLKEKEMISGVQGDYKLFWFLALLALLLLYKMFGQGIKKGANKKKN